MGQKLLGVFPVCLHSLEALPPGYFHASSDRLVSACRDERDGASSCWLADSARKYLDFGNGESAKTKPTPLVPASS